MSEYAEYGHTRFKCPFKVSRKNAKHCAACRADWLEKRRDAERKRARKAKR